MWATTMKDGDVLMGIYGNTCIESIEKIFDQKGELLPEKHFKLESYALETGHQKISFHRSGKYKLIHKLKDFFSDRITINGIPLQDIVKPTRMLEIILPKYLKKATAQPNLKKDLIIDVSTFPEKPLRCTISCMQANEIDNFCKSKIVDTSIMESSHVLVSDNTYWVWTMRVSKKDEISNDTKFILFLPGKVRWLSFSKSIYYHIKHFIKKYAHI